MNASEKIKITVSTHDDFLGDYADEAREYYKKAVIKQFSNHDEFEIEFDENQQTYGWVCTSHMTYNENGKENYDSVLIEYLLENAWNNIYA